MKWKIYFAYRIYQGQKGCILRSHQSRNERNLELLAQEAVRALAPTLKDVSFRTTEHLLSFIGENVQEKLVFIIDEIPYWAEKDGGLLSVFQKYADGRMGR